MAAGRDPEGHQLGLFGLAAVEEHVHGQGAGPAGKGIDEPVLTADDDGERVEESPPRASTASSAEPVEVAKYQWDAIESAFMGPICDRLPDPPGGTIELNLERSVALVPVGGLMPDRPEIRPPVGPKKEEEPLPF